jgi:uncharacterized protein YdeI (YjbR/CyaY-like superfamily)
VSEPVFFRSQGEFRKWLERHHAHTREVTLGFYKKASGKGGLTPDQALDEALCFGWIDGVRHSLNDEAFTNRYSPRTKRSYWSAVNIGKFESLKAAGRVHPAGQAAFDARDPQRDRFYSNENRDAVLPAEYQRRIRANEAAWEFWERQPPGYKRVATHWVMSAKQETTRERRLATLMDDSANGRRIALATPGRSRTR